MQKYADSEQFEKAAKMRDSYLDLQKTLERQKVVYENTKLNEDIIAVLYEDGILAIVIMMIREGRLIDKKDFTYFVDNIDKTEYFETFFRDYYTGLKLGFPDKIVSKELEDIGDKSLYEDWLKIISGKKLQLIMPRRVNTESWQSWQ